MAAFLARRPFDFDPPWAAGEAAPSPARRRRPARSAGRTASLNALQQSAEAAAAAASCPGSSAGRGAAAAARAAAAAGARRATSLQLWRQEAGGGVGGGGAAVAAASAAVAAGQGRPGRAGSLRGLRVGAAQNSTTRVDWDQLRVSSVCCFVM